MLMDYTNKLLVSASFLVLLAGYCVTSFVHPMNALENALMLTLAMEPVLVAMLRRTLKHRRQNPSTGIYYGKIAVVITCMAGAVAQLLFAVIAAVRK